jgi:hypothetical protein
VKYACNRGLFWSAAMFFAALIQQRLSLAGYTQTSGLKRYFSYYESVLFNHDRLSLLFQQR